MVFIVITKIVMSRLLLQYKTIIIDDVVIL